MRRYNSPTLADLPHRMIGLECAKCGRRGRYLKATLLKRYGPDVVLPELLHRIAQCERHEKLGDACGVSYDAQSRMP